MKKNILDLLQKSSQGLNKNRIQKELIENLYEKFLNDKCSKIDIEEVINIISSYLEFDAEGEPSANTLEIEKMIDWLLADEVKK